MPASRALVPQLLRLLPSPCCLTSPREAAAMLSQMLGCGLSAAADPRTCCTDGPSTSTSGHTSLRGSLGSLRASAARSQAQAPHLGLAPPCSAPFRSPHRRHSLSPLTRLLAPASRHVASAAGSASGSSGGGAAAAFGGEWQQLLRYLHARGHYAQDPQVGEAALGVDKGATKRAVLHLTRQYPQLLGRLDAAAVADLARCQPPPGLRERKLDNALRRLRASFVDGSDMGPGNGGAATFQDVMRAVLAAGAAGPPAPYEPQEFLRCCARILASVNALLAQPEGASADAAADAAPAPAAAAPAQSESVRQPQAAARGRSQAGGASGGKSRSARPQARGGSRGEADRSSSGGGSSSSGSSSSGGRPFLNKRERLSGTGE